MIKHLIYLISVIILYQLFNGCAQQSAPTGGPKDTIPPVRLLSIPLDKSTDFHGKTIEMEYDERLKISNIKEQLIITPLTESDYEFKTKKNKFFITFEEDFQDSTTYTLNFREAIQDITEGNPTIDNKFTFSTGSYIDSLSMTGYVKELLTYDTLENIVVGIYRAEDTVTIFDGSPYYFAELDEYGEYLIENIKNGNYLLYAFLDENKNLKLETNSESYGFVKDTLLLDSGIMRRNIDLIRLDLSEFRMISSVASGQYYDINFNKYITEYHVLPINSTHQLLTNRAKENKSIRFYNNFKNIDSLQITFTAIDSINTQITDTVYVLFKESKRNKENFIMSIVPESKSSIEEKLEVKIEFNKPIITINTDSIFVQFDTTKILQIHDSIFYWNQRRDELTFKIEIDKSKADTILAHRNDARQLKKDSVEIDKKEIVQKKQMNKDQKKKAPAINKGLELYFGVGSFYTADQDTSLSFGINYNFHVPVENGIQGVNITTHYESFVLQLINKDNEIEKESKNNKTILFKNVTPGTYKIRVLIDEDNDGKWSPGNMRNRIEPEPVYIYPDDIVIRADWQTSVDLTF